MNALTPALAAWLASLTLAGAALTVMAMAAMRWMRRRSAGARRLTLAAAAFGLLWAALSRAWFPAWTPGFLAPQPSAAPLDVVVERVDSTLDGRPVPAEVANRLAPPPALIATVQRHGGRWLPMIMMVWAAGGLLSFVLRLRGGWSVCRIIRRAETACRGDALSEEVAVCCLAAGCATPKVKVSTEVSGPFTCGTGPLSWLVLPASFARQDAAGRKAMIQHELAHLRHGDTLLQLMLSLLVCVQWFNPFVRWLERRLRLECEKACDDAALRHAIAPREYAGLLLELYQRSGRAPGLAATGALTAARRSREMMRSRVQSLADDSLARSAPGWRARRLLAIVALFCGSAAGATRLQNKADWIFQVAARPLPAADFLVAHWTLDGGEEPAMRPVNVGMGQEGRIDAAMEFNGADSYVDLDPSLVTHLSFPFTFCGWVRCTQTGNSHAMIFAGSNRSSEYFELGLDDGRAALVARRGGAVEPLRSPRIIADGAWHHVAGVFHSAERRQLFVDGVLAAEESIYRRRPPLTRLQIGRNGRDNLSNFLHGRVDDIRIYRTALKSDELQAIMQGDRRLLAVPVDR